MRKCPACGMSNSSANMVCLNCWERLDDVSDDGSLSPQFAHTSYGDPMLTASARIMTKALHTNHDATFKPSSIMLAGIFIALLLVMGGVYDWALIVLMATTALAGLFHLHRRSNRAL